MLELLYFTGKTCGVCQVLKPKLIAAVQEQFPGLEIRIIDIEEEPEFAGQSMVFTLPVVIIKQDGKEAGRFKNSFSVYQVLDRLAHLSSLSNS